MNKWSLAVLFVIFSKFVLLPVYSKPETNKEEYNNKVLYSYGSYEGKKERRKKGKTCPKRTDFINLLKPRYRLTTQPLTFLGAISSSGEIFEITINGIDPDESAINYSVNNANANVLLLNVWSDINFDALSFIVPLVGLDSQSNRLLSNLTCEGKLQPDSTIKGTCQTVKITSGTSAEVFGDIFTATPF